MYSTEAKFCLVMQDELFRTMCVLVLLNMTIIAKTEKINPTNLVKLYRSLVVPQLEYASPVWQIGDCSPLDKIQRKGLAIALGLPLTAGIEATEVEAGILPIDLRREELAVREMAKILAKDDEMLIKKAFNTWRDNNEEKPDRYLSPFGQMWIQISDMQSNTGVNFHNLEQQFSYMEGLQPSRRPPEYWKTLGSSKSRTKIQEQEARVVIQEQIQETGPATVIAFTDGSCRGNPGPCGAGACLYLPRQEELIKLKKPVAKTSSILLGEIVAINITLKFCLEEINRSNIDHIRIFSDSQSSIGILHLGWDSSNYKTTVKETQSMICQLHEKNVRVDLCWTPGHADIEGNETADCLAKEAAIEAEEMDDSISITTSADIRTAARKSCETKWQRRWELSDKGRHLYELKPEVLSKDKFTNFLQSERIIHQLRTGYCQLNYYRHKIGLEASPLCQCGDPETIEHYIEECTRYEDIRERLRTRLCRDTGIFQFNKDLLLSVNSEDPHYQDEYLQQL